MNKINSLIIFIVILSFFSCEQNEISQVNEISQIENKFTPLFGKDFTLSGVVNSSPNSRIQFKLFSISAYIGRGGCSNGSGICRIDICFFCRRNNNESNHTNLSFTVHESSGLLKKINELNNYYFEIKLNNNLNEKFDTNFYIDEEIEFEKYLLLKGVYKLDSTIGDFGGYKIFLTPLL